MVAQNALADSAEQKELRDTVRRLLRDKAPLARLRSVADEGLGFDEKLWRQLAELGLVALAVPEEYDGLGQSAVETSVVFEELGRGLYHGPYLATVGLAIPALLASGDSAACAELLPAIAAGERVATLAVAEASGRFDTVDTATRAVRDSGGDWTLTGGKDFVLDGQAAGLLLVTAATEDGVALFAVDGAAAGLTRTARESMDLARSVAAIELVDTPARLIGTPGSAPALVSGVLDGALVSLAAEQAGGAGACLDMCVEYAKTRQQFGRAIGSFQAVAHKLVDMLRDVEFARSAARYAAAAQASESAEFGEAAQVAAAYCGEAFRAVTVETVQAHGGIGFTWEHDAHLYYRRAWSAQHLFGSPDDHYLAVATRIGL